ncbi:MAG: 4'-phosphopantetheinyl transferase superfamily protein [Micromonosporaceae bacterium]|nr:4'-phosphopantetheinyl transferase superfamily protein [Micromonosporaceae bacterium]
MAPRDHIGSSRPAGHGLWRGQAGYGQNADVDTGHGCDVWWARPSQAAERDVRLLSDAERWRLGQLHRAEDRDRFLSAAVLLRRVVAAAGGVPPERVVVDRTCPSCTRPHGRPVLPDTGLYASVSHSGERIAVALTRLAPVGVDVEQVSARIDPHQLAGQVLGHGEQATDTETFLRYWTRKEAVVKATGDGLRADLRAVLVGRHDRPQLLDYPGRPGLQAALSDLDPGDGYLGALCVLSPDPVPVAQRWYAETIR